MGKHITQPATPTPPTRQIPPVPLPWLILLSTVALAISSYLLWGSLQGQHLPGCGPDSGCDAVLGSRWAKWFGLPVSLAAILSYLALLTIVALARQPKLSPWHLPLNAALEALAVVITGAALWFIALQLFVIRAICPFCMVAHACGLGVGFLLLRAVPTGSNHRYAYAGGFLALGLLIGGQIIHQPASFQVSSIAPASVQDPTPGSPDNDTGQIDSPAPPRPKQRLLQLHDGLFELDLYQVPLVGSPEAKHVVLHFFDYTCEHCRELHPILNEVHHAMSNELAIVQLPVPLDTNCNALLKRPITKHLNACDYARTALAVWRSNPTEFPSFEDWVFEPSSPLHHDLVALEAARRIGTNALASTLKDPWIDKHLAFGIRLYHTNYLRYQKSRLPLMMIGTNLVSGTLRSTNDFYRLLRMTSP